MTDALRIAVRVDAGGAIGVGHAMRCATLAEALIEAGHVVTVVSASMPLWVADRFRASGAVVEAHSTGPVDVWIVDGYLLGAELIEFAETGPVVAIDDNAELPVAAARLVVNQNLHARRSLYADVPDNTRLLLGPTYAMIRSDVRSIDRSGHRPGGRSVLVSFGGTDPARLTAPVTEMLLALPDVAVVVALGTDHPDRPEVQRLIDSHGERAAFDPGDLTAALRTADVAAIGGGSTLWEVASLGIPAVAAVVADNQVAGTAAAEAYGFVVGVDVRSASDGARTVADAVTALLDDVVRRDQLGSAGHALFDGFGARRVVEAIEDLAR